MAAEDFITLRDVGRTFGDQVKTVALRDASFSLPAGSMVVILGPSGSGKTTLLNLIGGLDAPSQGDIVVDGRALNALSDRERTDYRRQTVGFVFQFFNLIPSLTVRENVAFAAELVGDRSLEHVDALLHSVGLSEHLDRYPSELSGGQQQRVAIARALAKKPRVLLADEPTGALDEETGKQILKLLVDAARERGVTVLVVTHHGPVSQIADRTLRLRSGAIVSDEANVQPLDVDQLTW